MYGKENIVREGGKNSNIHKRSQNDERSDPEMSTAVFCSVFARGRTEEGKTKHTQKNKGLDDFDITFCDVFIRVILLYFHHMYSKS